MNKLKEVLKSEASEYFEHNESSKGVIFFMLDLDNFDDNGEYNYSLYEEDNLHFILNEEEEEV